MSARKLIPAPLISVVAEVIAATETHATLDSLFMYAGAPGDPPPGSKPAKALEWLRQVNRDTSVQPLDVLGRLLEGYLDATPDPYAFNAEGIEQRKERLQKALAHADLSYSKGGHIGGQVAAPSRSLEERIRDRDFSSINAEFDRALRNVEASPREAVSAACNLLESLCKTYIEDEKLTAPSKLDLQGVWAAVRKDLGFDPSAVADRDLQEILSGLIATVNGIGALRTHASSAHGPGRTSYKLEPRHARLAIHSAHTIALFVLESWDRRKQSV